jgi:hypothetical protein
MIYQPTHTFLSSSLALTRDLNDSVSLHGLYSLGEKSNDLDSLSVMWECKILSDNLDEATCEPSSKSQYIYDAINKNTPNQIIADHFKKISQIPETFFILRRLYSLQIGVQTFLQYLLCSDPVNTDCFFFSTFCGRGYSTGLFNSIPKIHEFDQNAYDRKSVPIRFTRNISNIESLNSNSISIFSLVIGCSSNAVATKIDEIKV